MSTPRPDTIFGASFVAVAADHPVAQGVAEHNQAAVDFIALCKQGGTTAAEMDTAELGFDTGLTARHPFSGAELPVYIANFVLMEYGTGAIMAVPGHDQRDFDFAKKYDLPIVRVVAASAEDADKPFGKEAEAGDGILVNSDFLNGLSVAEAKKAVIARIEEAGWGEGKTVWRLRDWGVSRQRYWGTPIPFIHCEVCGVVPVPKKQLPVTLPEDVDFATPGNPLQRHPTWKHVDCPQCGVPARRKPTRWTRLWIPAGTSCASPASLTMRRSILPKSPAGCPLASISAGSSMRSCICSMPGSGPAPCRASARSR
jgi:leucyl-tRNA synthetase